MRDRQRAVRRRHRPVRAPSRWTALRRSPPSSCRSTTCSAAGSAPRSSCCSAAAPASARRSRRCSGRARSRCKGAPRCTCATSTARRCCSAGCSASRSARWCAPMRSTSLDKLRVWRRRSHSAPVARATGCRSARRGSARTVARVRRPPAARAGVRQDDRDRGDRGNGARAPRRPDRLVRRLRAEGQDRDRRFDEAARTTIVVESLKDLAMTHEIAVVGIAASDKPAFERGACGCTTCEDRPRLPMSATSRSMLNEKSAAVSKTHSRSTPCGRRRSSGKS